MTSYIVPFPPSLNSLYPTNNKTGRRFKSKKYSEWEEEACMMLRAGQAVYRSEMIVRPVSVSYKLGAPDKRTRDLANSEKALSDALVSAGILKDDSLIHELHMKWGARNGFAEIEITELPCNPE